MNKELTFEQISDKRGDYKTVFAIETGSERKFVHFLGYVYYEQDFDDKPDQYRLVEYCGYYVPLEEVLSKGLRLAEMDNIDLAKEYIQDIEDPLRAYNNWIGEGDGHTHAPALLPLADFNDKTPDGIYILAD